MSVLNYLNHLKNLITGHSHLYEILCCTVLILLLYFYSRLRKGWWRRILGASLDYHKFHLTALQSDKNIDEKTREFSMALLWAINKQLPSDLANGGGKALWSSFLGLKTSLNTCGSIFYESSRFIRFIDQRIVKLNDTLLSTFYRIMFLESIISPLAIVFMDIFFLLSLVKKPDRGAARLYIEMKREISE